MGNFVKRLVSAVILLPPVLFLIYRGGIYTNLLVGVVVLMCAVEFYRMLGSRGFELIFSASLTLLTYVVICYLPGDTFVIVTVILQIAAIYVLFTIKEIKNASKRVGYLIVGIVYLGVFPSFVSLIRSIDSENGFYYLLTFLSVIWLSDTFAYLIGKSLGRHRLYERISPKKTIEGSIGGIIGGLAGIWIMAFFFHRRPSLLFLILVGIFVNLAGQIGDLFESMFKREAGVKDSGDIIPGHGGVLDRVDAIIFSAPLMYIFVRYLL